MKTEDLSDKMWDWVETVLSSRFKGFREKGPWKGRQKKNNIKENADAKNA